jgi:hypothetical protein
MLALDGSLYSEYSEEIYRCKDIEELEPLANRLMNSISTEVEDIWQLVEEELYNALEDDFGGLMCAGEAMLSTPAFGDELQVTGIEMRSATDRNLEKYGMATLKGGMPVAMGLITHGGMYAVAQTVVAKALEIGLSTALTLAGGEIVIKTGSFAAAAKLVSIGLGAIAWAPTILLTGYGIFKFIKSMRETKARQFQEVQQKLHDQLKQVLTDLYSYFLEPDPEEKLLQPRIDDIFENVTSEITQQFDSLVNERLQEADGEINLLRDQLVLDEKQRQAEAEIVQGHLDGWNNLGAQLKTIGEELSALTGEL